MSLIFNVNFGHVLSYQVLYFYSIYAKNTVLKYTFYPNHHHHRCHKNESINRRVCKSLKKEHISLTNNTQKKNRNLILFSIYFLLLIWFYYYYLLISPNIAKRFQLTIYRLYIFNQSDFVKGFFSSDFFFSRLRLYCDRRCRRTRYVFLCSANQTQVRCARVGRTQVCKSSNVSFFCI